MSHSMKIWEKVIERRIREESKVSQNQFGFMDICKWLLTTDTIIVLRQLCENYR